MKTTARAATPLDGRTIPGERPMNTAGVAPAGRRRAPVAPPAVLRDSRPADREPRPAVPSVAAPGIDDAVSGRTRVLVLAGYAPSLINFRGPLLRAMAAEHAVVAAAPEEAPRVAKALADAGVGYRRVPMGRTGTNPLADLRSLAGYVRLLREERPDVVLAYTMKPIIYGGIAARIVGGSRFFAMNTGLGHVFAETGGVGRRLLRALSARLYRLALRRAESVFFFNPDDQAEFARRGILDPGQRVVRVDGSGVDLEHFADAPPPKGGPVFLLIARLLRDKGLFEYAEAARRLRAQWPEVRFQILGPLDPNPSSITQDVLESWKAEGVVEYLGATDDVRPYLRACTVFVLPTAYREGIPRSLLEAMAVGRPLITTDAPGCRETVREGENGLLVPVRDADALTAAMARFLKDPDLAVRMGRHSRAMAKTRFDVRKINDVLLTTMGLA